MKSPVHAMLWETWRVTRDEAVLKLALGAAGGLTVLGLTTFLASLNTQTNSADFGAVFAMVLLVLPHFVGWISPAKLNGGKPGFPLYLLYTRPVRTSVLVGVPLAYLTIVPAAIYLVSALLLRVTFDYPFPLLPVAAWIAILNLVLVANYWSARRMIFVMLGTAVVCVTWFRFAQLRIFSGDWDRSPKLTWPTIFDIPLTDYALIALIGLAAFGFAVARVARQRRGDVQPHAPVLWTPGAGFPERLVNLFGIPCPTSSATRAQLWFDLKSTGLPVLTIGVALAISSPLLIAVSGLIDGAIGELRTCSEDRCFYARPLAALFTMLAPVLVLILGGNAFGFRQKQGRKYISAFETTQPYSTAQLAVLKILVRSACVLAALIAVGVSIWASQSFVSPDSFEKPFREITTGQRDFVGVLVTMTGYEQLALAFVVVMGVVLWVAASAVLAALRMRYSRSMNVAALLLLLLGIPLALIGMSEDPQAVNGLGNTLRATSCAVAVPTVFFTVYLFWSGFTERLLTPRYVCGAVAIFAAFGAAWVTVLHAAGVQFAGASAAYVVSMLFPALLLLAVTVLAPAAFSRIRSPSGTPTNLPAPVMNDFELTVALATAPSSAFAALRDRPRFWFPLLLVVLISGGLLYWYYSMVDFEWFKEVVLGNSPYLQELTEAEQAARMSSVSRHAKLRDSVIANLIAIPISFALQALYLLLTAKVTKVPLGFKHWFALTCWCSLPVLLGGIVSAIRLLLADTPQVDRSVLNPLSLNQLLFHMSRGDPWHVPLEMLNIPTLLSLALTLIGVHVWSRRSWTFSATMFLLPFILTFGIWVFLLSR